jgi:cell pole-organizing protein PopZ
MSGPNPNPNHPPQSGGASEGAGGDPSMEDILASIRRILSEEEGQGAQPSPPDDDGVLQLDQAMMVPGSRSATPAVAAAPPAPETEPPRDPEPAPPVHLAEPVPEPHVTATPPTAETPAPPAAQPPGLVAPEAAAAAAQSVGSLVRRLSAERTMQVHAGGPTIEDIVRQEMRPLLKEWLDANLPTLVERLVRAEIERVVGRAVP